MATNVLERRVVTRELLRDRGDLMVVAGLGAPAWDCTAAGDHPLTFPLWGAMGGACMIGLGIAIAQPSKPVLVVTGDGEMLMGLGSLGTLAVQRPANLSVVVLDNEHYGETGMQKTHTAHGVDIAKVALACGFKSASVVTTMAELALARKAIYEAKSGPHLYQVKIGNEKVSIALPPRDGPHLKNRFRQALLGDKAFA
jgi:thiamine pyrophosphate-dependent acetolactate synthase large subunit-like protein